MYLVLVVVEMRDFGTMRPYNTYAGYQVDISGGTDRYAVLRVSQIRRERENNTTITCKKILVGAEVGLCFLCRASRGKRTGGTGPAKRPAKGSLEELARALGPASWPCLTWSYIHAGLTLFVRYNSIYQK